MDLNGIEPTCLSLFYTILRYQLLYLHFMVDYIINVYACVFVIDLGRHI